jgi:hypothetical protein
LLSVKEIPCPGIARPATVAGMSQPQTIDFTLLNVAVPAVTAALVVYLGAVLKNKGEARAKIDAFLLERRSAAHQKLWELTATVPLWDRSRNATLDEVQRYADRLNEWYYKDGGLYLSRKAIGAFNNLMEAITEYEKSIRQKPPEEDSNAIAIYKANASGLYENIRAMGSNLRSQLAGDLLSRRSPPRV